MFITGCDDTFYETYNDLTGPVESVDLQETATVMRTQAVQLKAEVYPVMTDNKKVTWSSVNGTGSITVDQDGVITGISEGTATVAVTTEDGSLTASCAVTVVALTKPDAPGVPVLKDGAHKLTVSWTAVPRATFYRVYYGPTSGSYTQDGGDITGTTYTITGLLAANSYNVKIKAGNSVDVSDFSDPATGIAAYALRDTGPGGGLIFYDAGSIQIDSGYGNWRYMESSPLSTEISSIQWGLNGTAIGLTGSNLGNGSANSAYIISWLNVKYETNRAAQVANAVTTGGYSWFLPSLGELRKMYTNLQSGIDENGQTFASSGIFGAAFYWSSTENNSYTAYAINFINGQEGAHGKDGSFSVLSNYRVRAVRRF